MKIKLLILWVFFSVLSFGQSPAPIFKIASGSTLIASKIPEGTILINEATDIQYTVLKPLPESTPPGTTIDDCILLLRDNSNIATAQLKTINRNSSLHFIGELYGGGIVAAVWKTDGVEHGLIVSLVNFVNSPISVIWWNGGSWNETTNASDVNDGLVNRNLVAADPSLVIKGAYYLCDSYTAGAGVGTIWYLPSNNEWSQIYHSLPILQAVLAGVPGAQPFAPASNYYWTSTEKDNLIAYRIDITTGEITENNKKNDFGVRAVKRY